MELDYKQILGWLSDGEAQLIYDCAILAPIANFLEIGTFAGKSASVIGSVAKARKGFLICMDFFASYTGVLSPFVPVDIYKTFKDNMINRELQNHVITIRGNTEITLKTLDAQFGMIFIDGGHIEKYLMPDTSFAYTHIVNGGYILFHDYDNPNWPDVKKVVDLFLDTHKDVTVYKQEKHLLALKKS